MAAPTTLGFASETEPLSSPLTVSVPVQSEAVCLLEKKADGSLLSPTSAATEDEQEAEQQQQGKADDDDSANGKNKAHEDEGGIDDVNMIGDISYLKLFLIFLWFGFRAWGGPVAQISMLKEELVIQRKWTTPSRFLRVLAVYQVLPGPEATELCVYFGMLARGRIGAILAGLGFILPGFGMLLFLSWIYVDYGLSDVHVRASFTGVQAAVASMVLRAVQRLGEHALRDQKTGKTSTPLFFVFLASTVAPLLHINFFIIMAWCGLVVLCWCSAEEAKKKEHKILGWFLVGFLVVGACIAYGVYVGVAGFPSDDGTILVDVNISQTPGYMFVLGLLGGLVTFGGAYTAVPFVQQFAVNQGMWLTTGQFLDGLALASIIPAPLVAFVVFVGYLGLPGMRVLGAFLMFFGMMLPAFTFTLVGHHLMEKVVHLSIVAHFLDGVTASVIGLVLLTALQIIRDTVTTHLSLFIFFTSIYAQLTFKHPMVPLIVVFLSAVAGQVLLLPPNA